jgi:hypothetical protein
MLSSTISKPTTDNTEELHRNAYNAAFCELGLRWHWDLNTYRDLLSISEEKGRVRAYIETQQPHLLRAYDADFLVDAIQTAKTRCYNAMIAGGATGTPYINWAEFLSAEVGI